MHNWLPKGYETVNIRGNSLPRLRRVSWNDASCLTTPNVVNGGKWKTCDGKCQETRVEADDTPLYISVTWYIVRWTEARTVRDTCDKKIQATISQQWKIGVSMMLRGFLAERLYGDAGGWREQGYAHQKEKRMPCKNGYEQNLWIRYGRRGMKWGTGKGIYIMK